MRDRPYTRRRYFVNAAFQLRYMSVIIFSMLTASLIVGYRLDVGIWGAVIPEFSEAKLAEKLEIASRLRDYNEVRYRFKEDKALSIFREAELLSGHEKEAVSGILRAVNLKLMPQLMAVILLMAIASIFISHKIAGPIYRFEKVAMSIGEGDLTTKFRLRKGDEFKDLADALEDMERSLRYKIMDALVPLKETSDDLDKLSHNIKETAEERQLISRLRSNLNKLEEELSAFKVD